MDELGKVTYIVIKALLLKIGNSHKKGWSYSKVNTND